MTTGEFDPKICEINPGLRALSELLPPIDTLASIRLPELTQPTPEEQAFLSQLMLDARVFLGGEMLEILSISPDSWGEGVDIKLLPDLAKPTEE